MGDAILQRSFRKRKYVNSKRVLLLEKALDLSLFIGQLEKLIAQPIKIPSNHQLFSTNGKHNAHNFFSVNGIWPDEVTHRNEVSKFFNNTNIDDDRKQLLSLMIDDSDSDSNVDQPITVRNLHQMLKIHRKRRKYQTKCHDDPLNMQYKYYGAGLLSNYDKFPAYQQEVRTAFSYDFMERTDSSIEEFEEFNEENVSNITTPIENLEDNDVNINDEENQQHTKEKSQEIKN